MPSNGRFWLQWVVAHAAAHGLALTAAVLCGYAITQLLPGVSSALVLFDLAVALVLVGSLGQGVLVGAAQWGLLRRLTAQVTWKRWVGASCLGAAVAWGFVTILLFVVRPALSQTVVLGLGLLFGIFQGLPQAKALKSVVPHAYGWVLLQGLAWAAAAPLVVSAGSVMTARGFSTATLGGLFLTMMVAGTLIGAISAVAIAWIRRNQQTSA